MPEPTVELRLNGAAFQTLVDNAHVPGYPDRVSPDRATEDDADRDLHRAAARWYVAATRRRVGRGYTLTGPASPADAMELLNYLEGVAGALCAADDAEVRAEGRAIGRGVDFAVEHLRRRGTEVLETQSGPFTSYAIDSE
jgi:hypothetical protein